MKYAIIQTSGGNFTVKAEGFTDINKARNLNVFFILTTPLLL